MANDLGRIWHYSQLETSKNKIGVSEGIERPERA